MSHPFGDLVSQHLHRKHGLSQAKLAAGILQTASIISEMCQGKRLQGKQARERVVAIIAWLQQQDVLATVAEADALLEAAGIAALHVNEPTEAALLRQLSIATAPTSPPPPAHTNLPALLTNFIGRTREMNEITSIIAKHRLVTLTGTGGCGKTRLALALAERLLPAYADGVYFVPLAPVADPALIAPAIAGSVGLSLQGGAEPHHQICDFLRHKGPLLVIDNVEHLLPKVELLSHLLQQAPQVRLLATSREPLHLYGESTYPLAGLLPSQQPLLEEIKTLDAVQLFIQRAQRSDATFQPQASDWQEILHICRLVDGLPLGIELAASWVRLLSCTEIRLELTYNLGVLTTPYADVPERHRSLSAVIQHSWDLLTRKEQDTLAALSVFRGGCERIAAAQVTQADLRTLSALVDKSLLRREANGRYTLHEVVRQFADEQLRLTQQEAPIKDAHLAYYLTLSEQADREILGPAQFEWLPRMATEQDNLRAALAWCQTQPERLTQGLRLTGTLLWYWVLINQWREGRQWTETFLQRTAPTDFSEARGLALFTAGGLCVCVDDYPQARQYLTESLSILRQLDNHWRIPQVMCALGIAHLYQVEFDQAEAWFEQSLALLRAGGDQADYLWSLEYLGQTFLSKGDYQRAYTLLQECLTRNRQIGYSISFPQSLVDLARVERCFHDLDSATAHLEECLVLAEEFNILRFQSLALSNLGWIALQRGSPTVAHKHFLAALRLFRQLADRMGIAEALEGLAAVAAAQAEGEHAARLLGTAEALREQIGVPIPIENRATVDETVARLGQLLATDVLTASRMEGRRASLAKTLDELLS